MKLDEREFESVSQQITAAQNDYLIAYLRVAGALELFQGLDPKQTEIDVAKVREQLLTKILLSGLKARILAGCLTEVGKKWSRLEADRNAERFDAIVDPEEQTTMTSGLVGVVIGFFPYAGSLSTSSPKSSNPSDADQATKNAAPEISASSLS